MNLDLNFTSFKNLLKWIINLNVNKTSKKYIGDLRDLGLKKEFSDLASKTCPLE